jgi:ribA/ribD-fused uncharacterized protein
MEKIASGNGSWGDAFNIGITAATFFIPPAKLLVLPAKALSAVIKASSKVVANDVASVAAKNAAAKTLDDALKLKHQREGRELMGEPTPTYQVPQRTIRTEGGREVEVPSEKVFGSLGKDTSVKTVSFTKKQIEEGADLNLPENVRVSPSTAIDDAFTPGYVPKPDDPTIPRQLSSDKTRYAADAEPVELTEKLIDEIDDLYKKVDKLSDVEFNSRRAQILLQLFPGTLFPDIADITRSTTELLISPAAITNLKKKDIIRKLKKSEDPDKVRLAEELQDLDLKTLKQEVVKMGDGTRNVRENPYETTSGRSAIQPELENIKYAKERLEKMLEEARSPLEPADANLIKRLNSEIDKLDEQAVTLQGYIDDPLSDAAAKQSTNIIPNIREERDTIEWLSPESYRAIKPKPKRIKAPDNPRRVSLSDLEADKQEILMRPKSESTAQALKQVNKEIADLKNKQTLEPVAGSKPNMTTGTAATKKEIEKLEKEIEDLRVEYKGITEPKVMENGKELSVEKQRKLISASAKAKANIVEKLKNPLSELFVKEVPLPPKKKQWKRAPNTREVRKTQFNLEEAKKELEVLREKYKATPVEDFVKRQKLKEKGKTLGDKIKFFDKSNESTGLVVRWNNLTKAEQADAVYIGRAGKGKTGKFGNLYEVGKPPDNFTVEEAVELYRKDLWEKIKSDPDYAKDIYALKGKKLACPGPEADDACHGQVIVKAIKYLDDYPELMKGEVIDSFRGTNSFLSNMSSSTFKIGETDYPTVEHFYQAMKTDIPEERAKVLAAKTAGEAKRIGRTVKLRKNWKQIQADVMMKALRAKFEQNPELRKKLIDTGEAELIEGNNWGDKFWGMVDGEGSNYLGKYLMQIRKELMEGK